MQGTYRQLSILIINHHRDFDFRGGDHLNVDAFAGQNPERAAGNTSVRAHPHADQGHLNNLAIARDFAGLQFTGNALEDAECLVEVVAIDRKGEVGRTIGSHILDDHVDFDIGVRHRAKNCPGNTRPIGHAQYGELGFIAIERDA